MSQRDILDFVVIGAQKAGSTFVMQCLQDHPGIYMPHGETPFFQDPDYGIDRLHVLEQAVRDAKDGQLRGIKRPNYLGQAEVPERIASHMPRGKIIAVLRNPVTRAISAYFHFLKAGHIPLVPVDHGLRAILEGKWQKDYPHATTILTYGRYDEHLARFAEYFVAERTKLVVLDDISLDPEGVVQDLYRFLEIDDSVVPQRTDERPMSATYSLNRLQINRMLMPLVYKAGSNHARFYPRPGTKPLRYLITGFDRYILAHLFKSPKPTIAHSVIKALKAYYKDDVERLRGRLNHPLEGW